jgi:hypothetical protein
VKRLSPGASFHRLESNAPSNPGIKHLVGVNDQLFFGEELKRAVTFHVDGVAILAVLGRKDGNDDAIFMAVSRFFDPFADRKFCHSELLSQSSACIIAPNWLTHLKQAESGAAAADILDQAGLAAPGAVSISASYPGKGKSGSGLLFRDGSPGLVALSWLILVNIRSAWLDIQFK